jgi:hypothetical protein
MTDARSGLEAVTRKLEQEVVDGKAYWFPPSRPRTAPPTAHLLSIYDEYISGYRDRSAIVSAGRGAQLKAMGNALSAIVVVNGQIAGTWKRRIDSGAVAIKEKLFARLPSAAARAVGAAVRRYGEFLGLPVVRA